MNLREARHQLQQRLRECLVQLDPDEHGSGGGSGFFVAPGYVLTCAHVAQRAADQAISGSWQGTPLRGRVRYASAPPGAMDRLWPMPDLAVVRLDAAPAHPCVRLTGREPWAGSPMLAIGQRAHLGPIASAFPTIQLHYAGMHEDTMRLAGDNFGPGMSGGPVLDLDTGDVCGLVKIAGTGLEGFAIPVTALRQTLPAKLFAAMMSAHDRYHDRDHAWVLAQETLWEWLAEGLTHVESTTPTAPLLRPREEASLLATIADLTGADVYQLHASAVGTDPLSGPGELRDLRDLAGRLADNGYQRGRLHPIIELAELLAEQYPDAAIGLRDWSTRVAVRQVSHDQLLERRRAGHARDRAVPGLASVVVQVEPTGRAPDLYTLTMWLYRGSASINVFLRDKTARPRQQTFDAVCAALPGALGQLGNSDAIIELVIPLPLFDEPAETWQVFRERYARLGYRYPVVLRDLDRFNDLEARSHSAGRWDWLSTQPGTALDWFGCANKQADEVLYRRFEQRPTLAAIGMPEPADHVLEAAISAGVPVAVWCRSACTGCAADAIAAGACPGKQFQQVVDPAVHAAPAPSLPALVKTLRNAHRLGLGIVLLWDNPYRGPHPRRLRQP